MIEDIYEEIVRIRSKGERAALATVVSIRGSAPTHEAAKMLIKGDGTVVGTIGGGCVEAEVWQAAREVMESGRPKVFHFRLDEKEMTDSGLICGGTLEVFLEPILSNPSLYIFGAGHICYYLARAAKMAGFRVVVIDDRPAFANPERFPEADEIYAEDFPVVFKRLKVDPSSYIAIVTRGHLHDETVLEWAMRTPAKYIGMIGSRRKIKRIFKDLEERGVPGQALDRIHAPIGIDIGAETPAEIAISILAEMIQVRRAQQESSPG